MSLISSREGLEDAQVFRAGPGGFIGFGIILGYLTILAVVFLVQHVTSGTVLFLVTCVGATLFVWRWLRVFMIEIWPTALRYRSLSQDRTIERAAITAARLSVEPFKDSLGPAVRLTVYVRSGEPPLIINAKVFSRAAIKAVRELVSAFETVRQNDV